MEEKELYILKTKFDLLYWLSIKRNYYIDTPGTVRSQDDNVTPYYPIRPNENLVPEELLDVLYLDGNYKELAREFIESENKKGNTKQNPLVRFYIKEEDKKLATDLFKKFLSDVGESFLLDKDNKKSIYVMYDKIEQLYNLYGYIFKIDETNFRNNKGFPYYQTLITFYHLGLIEIIPAMEEDYKEQAREQSYMSYTIVVGRELYDIIKNISAVKHSILDKLFDEKYKEMKIAKTKKGKINIETIGMIKKSDTSYLEADKEAGDNGEVVSVKGNTKVIGHKFTKKESFKLK